MRGRRILVSAASAMLACALTGCHSAPATPTGASDEVSTQWATQLDRIDELYPDANAAQLEVIKRSLKTGIVAYEDYKDRFYAYVDCLDSAGVPHDQPIEGMVMGQPVLDVGIIASEDDDDPQLARGEACRNAEFASISGLYNTQPSTAEWYDSYIEGFRDKLIECLEAKGYTVDDEMPTRDLPDVDAEGEAPMNVCAQTTGMLAGLGG